MTSEFRRRKPHTKKTQDGGIRLNGIGGVSPAPVHAIHLVFGRVVAGGVAGGGGAVGGHLSPAHTARGMGLSRGFSQSIRCMGNSEMCRRLK